MFAITKNKKSKILRVVSRARVSCMDNVSVLRVKIAVGVKLKVDLSFWLIVAKDQRKVELLVLSV